MENGGNMFNGYRGQNGNNTNFPWDARELHATRFDWSNINHNSLNLQAASTTVEARCTCTTGRDGDAAAHALMFSHNNGHGQGLISHQLNPHGQSLYSGDGSHLHPDPHLVCLKLGKRHYFEDSLPPHHLGGGFPMGKRGKPYNNLGGSGGGVGPSSTASMVATATVPRCQVEGCHVALVNAKDYHRRHKVCELHSKAPTVVVLGLEQRFCQQCSRFHVVSEFDDSKRSCRRRLAGHNERRRKSSHDSVSRNSPQDNKMSGRFSYLPSPAGRALSLLSSRADSLVYSSDFSLRSSAALRELIAENRAAVLARQLIRHHSMDDEIGDHVQASAGPNSSITVPHQHTAPHGWADRFHHETSSHVTLDLMQMQASSSAFGFLSVRAKTSKEEDEDQCSALWNSFGGTHVI